jgi:hypothetical protein
LLPLFLACLYIQRIKRWSNKTTTTKDNEQEGEGESRDKERKRETSLNQTFPIKHGRLYVYILNYWWCWRTEGKSFLYTFHFARRRRLLLFFVFPPPDL